MKKGKSNKLTKKQIDSSSEVVRTTKINNSIKLMNFHVKFSLIAIFLAAVGSAIVTYGFIPEIKTDVEIPLIMNVYFLLSLFIVTLILYFSIKFYLQRNDFVDNYDILKEDKLSKKASLLLILWPILPLTMGLYSLIVIQKIQLSLGV